MEKAPRTKGLYLKKVVPELMKEFGYKSPMAVPAINKIVVSIGAGKALINPKLLEEMESDLASITGQKPIRTKAKKSIAGFKVREGMVVGLAVTLRGNRMYEFFDRLVSIALPRIRDFRGYEKKSFDGNGNFSIGIKEHIVFPEVKFEGAEKISGLNVTISTTAKTDEEGYKLLKLLGFPLK